MKIIKAVTKVIVKIIVAFTLILLAVGVEVIMTVATDKAPARNGKPAWARNTKEGRNYGSGGSTGYIGGEAQTGTFGQSSNQSTKVKNPAQAPTGPVPAGRANQYGENGKTGRFGTGGQVARGTYGQTQGQVMNIPAYLMPRGTYSQAPQLADVDPVNPIADGPVVDPQTLPGGYAFPFINRGINGQKSIIPFNGMTDPLTSGGGFGSRYGGNWGGGGGYGGYGGGGYSSLPAWYLNLVNWNIR